ncbi:hypothetical protein MPSEU_000377300 [Mayamaea pseudoterrestris]|nr:hypothetical protein MPSEU_000377300 [Mayamaea pseudoterrestris]
MAARCEGATRSTSLIGQKSKTRRSRLRVAYVPTLLFCLTVLCFRLVQRRHFFGPGTLSGGVCGKTFDNSIRSILWNWHQRKVQQDFRKGLNYAVPLTKEVTNQVGVPVLTQAWMRETVTRSWRRHQHYKQATKALHGEATDCSDLRYIRPLFGNWYRPLEVNGSYPYHAHVVWVDASNMDALIFQHYAPLVPLYQRLALSKRVQLWALCHVALYGGIFVGSTRTFVHEEIEQAHNCASLFRIQNDTKGQIDIIMASPHHPTIVCVVRKLVEQVGNDVNGFEWESIVTWLVSLSSDQQAGTVVPQLDDTSCLNAKRKFKTFASLSTTQNFGTGDAQLNVPVSTNRWNVSVQDTETSVACHCQIKRSWSSRLHDIGCSPGWFCHRCLRLPWIGSHKLCGRWVCPTCYQTSVCGSESNDTGNTATYIQLNVEVIEARNSTDTTKRIPRIIHQTWFEQLSSREYPHLQRLQNSWKAMKGWEYRFYTDESAREFVLQHMPKPIQNAYDAIMVPAFKADFFRLCVLAIHGGVYADIDLMLEINLDNFITDDLSFFVPRDVNVDMWPDANYCVWNGLLGSSPGHPIVIKALEDLVNRALGRMDYFDIESNMCRRDLSAEVWKLRCSPMLLVTGPCALGISLSDALGRDNPLTGWDLGWQESRHLGCDSSPNYDWGHILILLPDRYDLREQRFTDVDRNLLIASTNQDLISTRPINDPITEHKHYSSYDSDVVGSRAYENDVVCSVRIRFNINHKFA